MTNVTLNTATRKCTADKYFLGYEGENKINKLIFKFEDGFRDGLGILNVKRGEEKGYLDLKKVGDTYELEVKSALLSKIGEITFQFSVNEPDGTVIKYDSFPMVVKDSIDTDTEMPEDYPNWVDMANAKLTEVDAAIKNAEHATENAAKVAEELVDARENGEFNGKDGFSPSAKVTQTEEGAKIEITDENGTTTAVVKHGQGGGEGGGTGADGFSPIANVTQTEEGAEIVITDKKGTTMAKIYNGKDGAAGNDGLTPHIGNNGNWWIGETDTGVKANGSGEGGLAELPIATADTLGGIKVGEGLEITEDGLLSALGGGTGVTGEVTALYKGAFSTLNSSLVLSDNINNYDILVVNTYIKGSGGHKLKTTTTVVVDQISYSGNEEYVCFSNTLASTMQYCYTVRFGFDTSGDTLLVGNIQKSPDYGTNEVGIDSVYGIKLGGGTGGGSYTETDLISNPIEYTITSGTTWTMLNTNIDFNEGIDNFNELDFTIELGNESGYYHVKHHSIKVSDIIYNDSETTLYNGSHIQIPFGIQTYICNIGGWFKTPNRFWVMNIGVYSLPSGAVAFTKARIRSIKGIKYDGSSSGGSSYKETDLISNPVDYAQGGTSGTTIGQDLVLLDDVTNYDEIVFSCARNQDGTKLWNPEETDIHTSNIVYNNTNTQTLDGSRITINTTADQRYSCGMWFKNGKTIRIHNTFATTSTLNANDKFRIISIKGIKY